MKKLLFLILFASTAHAEGPLFHHKETEKQQEFENVYKDIRSKVSSSSGTLSNPTITGIIYGSGTSLTLDTDIYTTAYQDYSSISTISGWSGFNSKMIYYKKIGKLVVVWFNIDGTSNTTGVTFTLPFTAANTIDVFAIASRIRDNGVDLSTPGGIELDKNTATVSVFKDTAFGSWTASNRKIVQGQFSYQSN